MTRKINADFIENFLVVWDPAQGSELYKLGFYGKPVGIPKPKIMDFTVPLLLDLMEGLYLVEKKIINVRAGTKRKGMMNGEKLRKRARKLYEEFDQKYEVYRDLRDHGLIVTPGIKYGCDFAVYKQAPGVEHAPFMVSVKKTADSITSTEIVKVGRLATTVRKRFIIAVPDSGTENIQYLMFKWFKA